MKSLLVAGSAGVLWLAVGCGEIIENPQGGVGGGTSSAGGAAGSGGETALSGAGGGGAGGSSAGASGSAGADTGGAGGGSMTGGQGGSAPALPADCPEINGIGVPGQQVVIRSMNFATSEVVLQNISNSNVTIVGQRNGWQWCNFPAYWTINEPADVVLSPGETFSFIAVYNTGGPREFDPAGGEMGIYSTTGSFTTAEFVRSFVSWGETSPLREPTAAQAGYWVFGERVEIGPNDDGFVIVGEADLGSGYQGVRAACLVAPPNEN